MNSGMYSALSGNIVSQQRLDILTNNLANVNTSGFKKDKLVFESLLKGVKNPAQTTGVVTDATSRPEGAFNTDAPVIADITFATDYSHGPLKQTGNALDVALDGDGFFVINTPQGRAYTRQGIFHLDSSKKLVTQDGYEVQGSNGSITIQGQSVTVDSKGMISVDGNSIGSVAIVDFPKPYSLEKIGDARFVSTDPAVEEQPSKNVSLKQGYLEESNVNPLLEMANLIEANRYFESCVKMVQSYDNLASKSANEIGRL